MVCVNKSLKEFKILSEYFNEDFAEALVRAMSKEKGMEEGDFYYPSVNEAISFIKNKRETTIKNLEDKFEKKSDLSSEDIFNLLKGILFKIKDKYYIVKGYVENTIQNSAIKKFVYDENIKAILYLKDKYPNIFSLRKIPEKDLIEVDIKDNKTLDYNEENLKVYFSYEAESGNDTFDLANDILYNMLIVSENKEVFHIYKKLIGNVYDFKTIIDIIKNKTGIEFKYTKEMQKFDNLELNEREKIISDYRKTAEKIFEKHKQEGRKKLRQNNLSEKIEYYPEQIIEGKKINPQARKIWNDIKILTKKLNIKIKFSTDKNIYDYDGKYIANTGEILINANILDDELLLTETIVHEVVHALTFKIISNVEDNITEGLTLTQIKAVRNLKKLYEEIKKDKSISRMYALDNIYEFIAYLSNEEFSDILKKKDRTFLEKIFDYILDILGIQNAEELTRKYLKDILSSAEYYLKKEGITVKSSVKTVNLYKENNDKTKINFKIENISDINLQFSEGEINTGQIEIANLPDKVIHKTIAQTQEGPLEIYINNPKLQGILLARNGKYLFRAMQGRFFVIAKVGNFYLPFYISSAGTSGKNEGEWYPFFGYKNWLVKGHVENGKMNYSPEIDKITKLLNENFKIPAKYFNQFGKITDGKGSALNPNILFYDINDDVQYESWYVEFDRKNINYTEEQFVADRTGLNPKNVVNDGKGSANRWINHIIKLIENGVDDFLDFKIENAKKENLKNNIIKQITLESVLDKPEISKKTGRIVAERLSRRFNVPYKFIKPKDIPQLEKEIGQPIGDNTKVFWNPNNGTIYFIEDRITEDTPFHEFLHPVIEYIYQYNKPLFQELVNDLNKLENPELQKGYSELSEQQKIEKDSIGFKLKSLKENIWNEYEGSETDKIKEYLVTVVGLVAADKMQKHGALKYGINSLEDVKHEERGVIRKIYTKILRFIREGLGIYKVKLSEIPKMTVNELAEYILVEKEKLDLFDIKPKDSIADADFVRSSRTMSVTIEDIKNKFSDPNLEITDEYYKLSNGTLLDRLTLFIHKNFSKKDKYFKKTPAEYRAASFFRSEGKDPDKEGNTVNYNGKDYTFEELVQQFEAEYKIGTIVGTLYHKIIEWAAKGKNTNSSLYREIIQLKDTLESKGVSLPLLTDNNNNIDTDKIDEILERLGLIFYGQYSDVYEPELVVFDEDLGIGTTIDALIRHADGTYSILDFKTGQKFFSDQGIVKELLKYAEDLYHDFPDTKLSRAKLEIAFRAFLLKKNFSSIRFRDLAVAHINKKNVVESFDVELDSALTIIERFYKEKYKNDPDKLKELEELKLFDSTEYYGSNSLVNEIDIEERLKDKSYEEKIAFVESRIEFLQSQSKMGVRSRAQKEELARLSLYLLQLKSSGEKINEIPEKDLGGFRRLFGSYFDANIPILQSLMKLFRDKKNKAQQKIYEMEAELDHLMEKVKEEYFANNPTRALLNKGIAGGIKYFSKNQDGSGIFDFIWVYREKEVGSGYYMITENDPEWDNLTEAQKAYVKKAREIMHKQWKETMANSYVKNSDNRLVSKAEAMGYPEVLPEDFMPRIAMNQEEMLEHYPLLSKETLDYQYKKALGSFLDDPSYNVISDTRKENYNVAVKYMGNNTVIAKQNHSFNAHEAIKMFTKNLINKQEMDSTVAVAEGVIHYLQDIGYKRYNDPEYFKKAQNFILDQILIQAKEERKETALSRKNIKIPGTNKEINAEKAMSNAKAWVSGATMWFQPVAGTFNGFLIFLLNLKEAVVNDLSKTFGTDYSKYGRFGLKEYLWAISIWARMQFSLLTNDTEGKKLKEFAKMLNYLPDNYDYAIRKKNSVVGKNKLADVSHLYFFHQIGEDFGTFTILASQLKTIKTVDKDGNIISMWDAYDFDETGKLVYVGGKRGVNTKGEELRGLTSEEISRMKEVSRAIHGAYRTEEKTAMELTALGQWVMQFRKFVPTQILNAYGSMHKSTFRGYYEYKGKTEQGEDIYEWQNNIVEGRIRTFLKVILTAIRLKNDPNYRWTNLSYEQKRNLADIAATSLFFVLALASMSMMFDDDDEDTQAYKRMYKLALDLTTSYHPLELLNNITNFTAVLNKGKTAVKGFGSFLLEGILEGKEAAPGVPKGLKPTLRHIPLVNGWYQIQLFLYNDKALTDKEKESWFDKWSFDEGR
ncbi:MAG: hypothetical protein QXL18_01795 [Candidatus Woesearchaeota archaeon]